MAKGKLRRRKGVAGGRARRPGTKLPPGLEGGKFQPLTLEEIRRIHAAALRVLERTGVEVQESECRSVLQQAGARTDTALNRVFLPEGMVSAALKSANRDVVLYSQDGQTDLHLRGQRVHLGTGGAAIHVVDLLRGRVRDARLRDLYDIGRLVDIIKIT